MHLARWKKVVLGIGGTVVLGALGSGFWELGLKPGAVWIGKAILTGATLGSAAVRDAIYREAAKGPHDAASFELFWLFVLFIYMCGGSILAWAFGRRSGTKASSRFLESLKGLSREEQRVALHGSLARSHRNIHRLYLLLAATVFFMGSIQLVSFLRLYQANAACTFFAQSLAICRPYLTDQDAHVLSARFAGMQGRQDFILIVSDLRRIASAHQLALPNFSPW